MPVQRLLQKAESRTAGLVEHDRLAIEDKAFGVDLGCSGCDRGEALGPVMATAGDDANAVGVPVRGRPVAVPLHLEEPIAAFGRLRRQQRQAWIDRAGIGSENRSLHRWAAGAGPFSVSTPHSGPKNPTRTGEPGA